jgi:hypothetical protein
LLHVFKQKLPQARIIDQPCSKLHVIGDNDFNNFDDINENWFERGLVSFKQKKIWFEKLSKQLCCTQ